jgi:Spy/CpxP family protein refolding chaperone
MSGTSLLEKAAAARSWDPKLACAVSLVLVFLSGAVVGALAMDLRVHNRQRPVAFDTPQGKALYFEHMRKELDLTPAQAEQMQSVLDDFWQYYRTVLTDGKQRVEQLLNPEQRKKFEQLLQQQLH